MALEAEIEQEEYIKNVNDNFHYSLMENQRLDCIYDHEPLGFEKDPMGPAKKMQTHDPLEEVDLCDCVIARFSLKMFLIILICVYICLNVINCLCVYFGWD